MDDNPSLAPAPPYGPEVTMLKSVGLALPAADLFCDPYFKRRSLYAEYMALRLMVASWHQRPAGSLPASLEDLYRLVRYGHIASFKRAAVEIMRDWRLASDGRLYHPYVTAAVLRARKIAATRRIARAERHLFGAL